MDCLFLSPGCGSELGENSQLYWQPHEGEGRWLLLAETAEDLSGRPLALVLPMEVASAFLVSLPTQKTRWMRQALPYAVEELLAEEVEQFHLALGDRNEEGRYRVIAIRHTLLGGWIEQLQAQGLNVAAIHMDADLLPLDGEQVVKLGERILLGGSGGARLAFGAKRWPQFAAVSGSVVQPVEHQDPYRVLSQGRGIAVNLAQGEFASRSETRAWTLWRPFVAVLGLWAGAYLGLCMFQTWQLEARGDALNTASVALYKELFPEDRRIINLRAQFAEHLARGQQADGDFLAMLQQVSRAIDEGSSSLMVVQVDFSQERGDLALQIRAKDFSALEQLRKRLVEGGVRVQLGSASREEQGITARVVLGGSA